jgi:hypothetical protein
MPEAQFIHYVKCLQTCFQHTRLQLPEKNAVMLHLLLHTVLNLCAVLPAAVQNPRNAEPVIQRNYTTTAGYREPWWNIASTYYNETVQSSAGVINASLYLDRPIRCAGDSTQQ